MNSLQIPTSSSVPRQSGSDGPAPQPYRTSHPSSNSESLASPRSLVRHPDTVERPKNRKEARQRSHRTCPGSIEMLAMLESRSVFVTPVPRHRVEPRAADGAILVHDRATGEQFVVYLPRFVHQFHAGHRAGFWYVRPVADFGEIPRSIGFRSSQAAVNALRASIWRIQSPNRTGEHIRTFIKFEWS